MAAVTAAPVNDSNSGWVVAGSTGGVNDRDYQSMLELYSNALEAWRKNPQARRIIETTTDYVLGDGLTPSGPGQLGRFIAQFWNHRQNRMSLRLPEMINEWNRAGDLFVALFRNPNDGMSYVRVIPKTQIVKIVTADNDWETELAYHERQMPGAPPKVWLSPNHPDAATADVVMMHYAINRPVGALWGDGDLTPVVEWLLRYKAMLHDRVELNMAARMFYWFVRVPKAAVEATIKKYSSPPPAGAVIVHDESQEWTMQTPNLGAGDAANDLQAVRMMIAVGAGQPPHWMGDSMDVNLATATAMERQAIRHLKRRQLVVVDMVIDLCYVAYSRAHGTAATRRIPLRDEITVELPDLSRDDNESLAMAGGALAAAFNGLTAALGVGSPTLREEALNLFFQFIGEGLENSQVTAILSELEATQAKAPADTADTVDTVEEDDETAV